MTKKLILPILISAVMLAAASCNKDSDSEEYTYEASSSVLVSKFFLQNDAKVLDSLSNVFFSIDLDNAQIFNADSLPYGTRVSRLIPMITAPSTARVVELQFPREGKSDSIVDYKKTTTDSIDFSRGPVKLRIVSESGLVERTYEIRVNVHSVKPDTLAWVKMENMQLPTQFQQVDAMRAASLNDTYYCLTQNGSDYCLAQTQDPADAQWQTSTISFPFAPQVHTLRATDDSLYILSEDGDLYASADFQAWTSTGEKWSTIYGGYVDQVLGCKEDNGTWTIVGYPKEYSYAMPVGFPVEGASEPSMLQLPMAFAPQCIITGGKSADGAYSNVSWGFDGQDWIQLTRPGKGIPQGLMGMTVIAYDIFQVPSSTWRPVEYPALLAFGGKNSNGEINSVVYISKDWGMTWNAAPTLLQLPSNVPNVYDASAFVYATTMHVSRSAGAWSSVAVSGIPGNCQWEMPYASRVSAPIDEWECPAIYMLGGTDQAGKVVPQIWRGMILRYTFQPKY